MSCCFSYGPEGSAICVYHADRFDRLDDEGNEIEARGIFTVFEGEYHNLRPGETSCTPNNVPNDNPFNVSDICLHVFVPGKHWDLSVVHLYLVLAICV